LTFAPVLTLLTIPVVVPHEAPTLMALFKMTCAFSSSGLCRVSVLCVVSGTVVSAPGLGLSGKLSWSVFFGETRGDAEPEPVPGQRLVSISMPLVATVVESFSLSLAEQARESLTTANLSRRISFRNIRRDATTAPSLAPAGSAAPNEYLRRLQSKDLNMFSTDPSKV
jgi:hypothetical protein